MRAAQLRRRPGHLQNFTGLSVGQFEELVKALRGTVNQDREPLRPRQRVVGGGCKAKLALEDQVLLTLIY